MPRACAPSKSSTLSAESSPPRSHRWPLAGPLEFVCEWPTFGIAETRADIDAQLILDAAQRSIRLWPEDEA